MQKVIASIFYFIVSVYGYGQQVTFPYESELLVKEGEKLSTPDIIGQGPVMIEFWNMGCGPCINFLDQVAERYDEWLEMTNTKIIAVVSPGIDKITPNFVESRNWPFPVYYDTNYQFYKQLSKAYHGSARMEGFPTAYVFNKDLELVDKLEAVKRKSDRTPEPGEELTPELLAIDFQYYYFLSTRWDN